MSLLFPLFDCNLDLISAALVKLIWSRISVENIKSLPRQ